MPEVLLLITIEVIVAPEHIVWLDGVAKTSGVGFTNTVAVIELPGQPFADGIIVKVTVVGAAVVLIKVPLISPEPLAAIPVTGPVLSLVHVKVVPPVILLKAIVPIATPEHLIWLAGVATATGVGFTNTVVVIALPGQLFADGVIVKVTVIGEVVMLVNVPAISAEPLSPIVPPIPVIVGLVHANVVPAVLLVNAMGTIVPPEHIIWLAGVATTFGVGFTNTVAVVGIPGQPFAVGVIVKVIVRGAAVVFVNVPAMLPVPFAAIPVTVPVLSLVHADVVPTVVLVKAIVVIATPEHLVWLEGVAVTMGVGFTIIVKLVGLPVHVAPPLL